MIWHYKYYTCFTNPLYNEYDSKITMKEINLPYPIIHHKKKKKKITKIIAHKHYLKEKHFSLVLVPYN